MPGGRPTKYTKEILERAREYVASCQDEEIERKLKVKIPTRGGLASCLGVSRETLYTWGEQHPEFLDIMEEVGAIQEERLINKGLSGDYNPTIAKVLLTKHGYTDKQEIDHTSKGESLAPNPKLQALAEKLNEV